MMDTVFKILQLVAFLAVVFLLVHKIVPWIVVRAGRKLGFRMRMTPVWAKRIARFKTIRRGYYSFLIITTLFAASFFSELILNNKALAVHYNGKTSFPAVKHWVGSILFFLDIPTFEKGTDFGQAQESDVDYRFFKKCCGNPDELLTRVADKEKELKLLKKELREMGTPDEDWSESELEDYKDTQFFISSLDKEIEGIRENHRIFKEGRAWVIMPLYPYSPYEHLDVKHPPISPSLSHPFGTDDAGKDVLTILFYGFRISLLFALVVVTLGNSIGIVVGGIMGYFGGWTDIIIQRIIEIYGSMPFFYVIMIIASITKPTFLLLVVLLVLLRAWIGITNYIRGEFYREKARDYVQAAIGIGASDWKVILKHILPNSLVPVITFTPFEIVGYVAALVSLDYLGFGLPVGTPSWGVLLKQGFEYIKTYPHLIIVPFAAEAFTLFCVVMIGEAVREAFDPKVFSRLR